MTKQRLVITWAQNATPVFKPFWRSLQTYCEHNDAQLLVIPGRYKNPTSMWSANNEAQEWWAEEVVPYLCNERLTINGNLQLLGNIKVQPTRVNPLSGKQTMGGGSSIIIGHPQIASESVPTPQSKMAKLAMTTGSITKPNFTDSDAGVIGAYHHEYGALLVEIDGGIFHARHIIADGSGKFYDLDTCYDGDKVTIGHRAEAFISGDLHAKFLDADVKAGWWTGNDALCSLINPKVQVFHDVFDGYFGSHHHRNDPFLQYRKLKSGDNLGMAEIEKTIAELSDCMRSDCKNYIVKSNHDEHLARWLKETDWRKDLHNAPLYLETALQYLKAIDSDASFDPIQYWVGSRVPDAEFLKRDSKLNIKGHALNYHGDTGPNGVRGSAAAFNRIGTKSVIGHSHSPRREKGCLQVGLSARYDLEYATGSPSSWMHTAAIIYPNGKSTLINCIGGRYRL